MANHNSPFLKRVLIPFWTLRLFFMLILIGLYGWAISVISSIDDDTDSRLKVDDDGDFEKAKGIALGILGAFLFLLAVCFLLDIVSIVLFARGSLRPKTFLIFNILQTLFWTVMLILAIVGAARASTSGGIILTVIIFLLYIGLLIYASVIYHRNRKERKYGSYQKTLNPGAHENPYLQPFDAETAHRGVHGRGASADYYNGPAVPPPANYYSRSSSPQPQQYQAYQAYKAPGHETSYEMPERPMH